MAKKMTDRLKLLMEINLKREADLIAEFSQISEIDWFCSGRFYYDGLGYY